MSALPPVVLGGLLVVPAGLLTTITGRSSTMPARTADTQAVAARARAIIMEIERGLGFTPVDREFEQLGYDIESRVPDTGKLRFIEVKGRAGIGEVALSSNEYRTAQRLSDDYWLYVVFDCGAEPRLNAVQNPAKLGWQPIVRVEHYHVGSEEIMKAAQS